MGGLGCARQLTSSGLGDAETSGYRVPGLSCPAGCLFVAVFGTRVVSARDIRPPPRCRIRQDVSQLCVLLHELWYSPDRNPGPVCPYEQLTITLWTGSNTDSRDIQSRRDLSGCVGRYHLQHDRKSASLLHGAGIGKQLRHSVAASLNEVPAEPVF